jgi:hypothetical protein
MSNELMSILQNNPQIVQTGLDEDTLAVAGNSQNANKRISIKGGVFRKYVGGKEVATIEDRHMNVIFVKMAHTASRMFYSSNYKEGEKIIPTCWSSDSRVPDKEVKTPQSSSCDTCQFSAKGANPSCRLSWRTAVVLPNDPSGDIMQMVIPSKSCFAKSEEAGKWSFRPYVQMLANNNISAGRVVTKMQFDTKSEAAKLLFSPAAAVSVEDMEILKRQAKSPAAEQAVKLTVYQASEEGEEVTPQATAVDITVAPIVTEGKSDVIMTEPVLQTPAPSATKVNDVSDIVKKWSIK